MDTNTGLLVGMCGLATVCSGLLFVMLLIILRVTGRNFMSFFSLLIRNRDTDEGEGGPLNVPRRRVNLRAKAESLDFDQALAAQAQVQAQTGTIIMPEAQAAPPPPSPFDAPPSPFGEPPTLPRRDDPLRRRKSNLDDDMIGGFLGEGDDGDLGF